MAEAVAEYADGITMINTLVGMRLDNFGKPILANLTGGLSGPAIKPVAINMVYQVRKALPEIPIIAMGGIATVEDIIDFISVGADAVAIGTMNFTDPMICPKLIKGLDEYLEKNNIAHLSDLKGRTFV